MERTRIPPGDAGLRAIWVFIEISEGSSIKYELNKELDCLMVDRFLHTAMKYPFNYGFIPSTQAKDGDPLDVVLLSSLPIAPGTLILARPVGLLEMEDEMGPDNKVIAVPLEKIDPDFAHVKDVGDLSPHSQARIKHFFDSYKQLEPGKWVKTTEYWNAEQARAEIAASLK